MFNIDPFYESGSGRACQFKSGPSKTGRSGRHHWPMNQLIVLLLVISFVIANDLHISPDEYDILNNLPHHEHKPDKFIPEYMEPTVEDLISFFQQSERVNVGESKDGFNYKPNPLAHPPPPPMPPPPPPPPPPKFDDDVIKGKKAWSGDMRPPIWSEFPMRFANQ